MQKILYVEDDLSLIDGLQYTLETSGYVVDNARTIKEALELFRSNSYDLLLLDVTLPDGSGFDICKEVRISSTVPIIFLTASDQEISIVRGLDMGADDYITKPFKLNELLSRIKASLRRSTQFSKTEMLEANGYFKPEEELTDTVRLECTDKTTGRVYSFSIPFIFADAMPIVETDDLLCGE